MENNLPVVTLIGRPNVGKSTLFNRLIRSNKAIISDKPGTTRDRNMSQVNWLEHNFLVYDTGGYLKEKKFTDSFQKEINFQIDKVIKLADLIVFVLDGKAGITPQDRLIASKLRKIDKKVILLVNKVDNQKIREELPLYYEFGFENVIAISALHGTGSGDLFEAITKNLNFNLNKKIDSTIKFSILGKQNVGKSTLTNSILRKDRVIVSEVAGTTRDPIEIFFNYKKEKMAIVDTAGIKRHSKTKDFIDLRSMKLAKETISESNVSVLLLDIKETNVDQAVRIGGYIHDSKKPVIIAVNKFDTINKKEFSQLKKIKEIKAYYKFLSYAQILFISALERKGVEKLLDNVIKLNKKYNSLDIKTSELNNFLTQWKILMPIPSMNGQSVNIKYGTFDKQSKEFILFVNKPKLLHFSYLRYLENQIRRNYDFEGIPVNFKLKTS